MATLTTNLTLNEYQTILRHDFYSFMERSFYELNPDAKFLPNWHIELIASELEACWRGETKRLIICVPPRSLKSHCASIAFPAWLLGQNPSAQVICASYGQELADKLARDCRTLMNSSLYRKSFPTRLSNQKQAVSEFMTDAQGFRLATSVGGVLTGRGGDYLIIDDPLKPDEALSETQRNAVNDWYQHTLYSRLNNKSTGCVILIMQRLHEDDLVGHLLEQGGWKLLRFPAIAVEDEIHTIRTRYGTRKVQRPAGEALHPEREPLEVLAAIRSIQGEYNFSGQYQQEPAPLGGGMVKLTWFKTYKVGEEPAKFDMVFQSWDTAVKATELSDYSVCTTWGKKENDLYLLHVLRRRLEYPELKKATREQANRFRATVVLIEDKSSGAELIQELLREGLHAVTRYEPKNDKIMRLHSVTSTIENGFLHLPDQAEWLAEYLHEMTSFPKGKFDDQCDSTSQALDWLKSGYVENGFMKWLELESEKMKSKTFGADRSLERCPACQGKSISHVGPQKRCLDCGKQWGQTTSAFSLPRRADVLSGRWRP
jgi:predicted phage terminase large subunit-like protein